MPCLNEAETLAACVRAAFAFLARRCIRGEVVVADNGSTDGSQQIARRLGARVVDISLRGYGAALQGGIEACRGRFVVFGDADDSYDFSQLDDFVAQLRDGADMVVGNRFRGGIEPRAMPPHHRYFGNPVLSAVGRLFFNSSLGDFHCGLRGLRRAAVRELDLQTLGMEFASEIIVKATLRGLDVREVPTTLRRDGRTRAPHLRSWHDGWRHLRFLLVYSPRWLFYYPGITLTAVGLATIVWLLPGPRAIAAHSGFDVTTMLYGSIAVLVGLQCVAFAVCSFAFGRRAELLPDQQTFERFLRVATLERSLVAGGSLVVAGILGSLAAFVLWQSAGFRDLDPDRILRVAIPSVTALGAGTEIVFASFFVSWLHTGVRGR